MKAAIPQDFRREMQGWLAKIATLHHAPHAPAVGAAAHPECV